MDRRSSSSNTRPGAAAATRAHVRQQRAGRKRRRYMCTMQVIEESTLERCSLRIRWDEKKGSHQKSTASGCVLGSGCPGASYSVQVFRIWWSPNLLYLWKMKWRVLLKMLIYTMERHKIIVTTSTGHCDSALTLNSTFTHDFVPNDSASTSAHDSALTPPNPVSLAHLPKCLCSQSPPVREGPHLVWY